VVIKTKDALKPTHIIISAHIHASEDEDRVLKAVKNILPSNVDLDFFDVKKEKFVGHHGNPITRVELRLRKQKLADDILTHILKNIKGVLYSGWLAERFDEENKKLYLRLDKQRGYLGEIRLSSGDDVIHIVISFPGHKKIVDLSVLEKITEHGL
jgi:hypothetical protein